MLLKKRRMVQGALMQACGHMYLDEGEELSTGTAKDNLLSFSAFTAAGGNGTIGKVRLPYAFQSANVHGVCLTFWWVLHGDCSS